MKHVKNFMTDKFSLDRRSHIFASYTVLFAFCFCLAFMVFFIEGKALMVSDGFRQHCAALAYWGVWLRKFLSGLFSGRPSLIQMDLSLGIGLDVVQTLHYYVIGDPVNLLAVFFSPERTEILYQFLVVLRMFLAGISFIIYCRAKGIDGYPALCASLAYAFCGYSLYCAARHPFFIPPMVYLPVICLGLDMIFEKKNPFVFVAGTALLAVTSFYFLYTHTLLILVYAVIHFFFLDEGEVTFRNFLCLFFRTAGFYVLGLALAGPVLFPNIAGFLGCARVDNLVQVPVLYEKVYYIKMLLGIVGPATFGSYSVLGFAAPVFPALCLVFLRKDRVTVQLRIVLCVCVFILLVPYMGHVMNGFNYVTNRWCSAVAFPACIAFARMIPLLCSGSLSAKEMLTAAAVSGGFSALLAAASIVNPDIRQQCLVPYGCVLLLLALLFLCARLRKDMRTVLLPVTVLSIIAAGFVRFSPSFFNYIDKFAPRGIFSGAFSESTDLEAMKIRDDSFHRIDFGLKASSNLSAVMGINSANYYWAQIPGTVSNFHKDMGLATGNAMHLDGFDDDRVLQDLFAVKYCVMPSSRFGHYSFGLERMHEKRIGGVDYVFARNPDALPAAWILDRAIPESDFRKMDFIEKRAALVQALVSPDETGLAEAAFDGSFVRECGFRMEYDGSDIFLEGSRLSVKRENAEIRLFFDGSDDSVNYLCLEEIYYDDTEEGLVWLSFEDKNTALLEINNKDSNQHSMVLNGGISAKKDSCFTLRFENPGEYSVGRIFIRSLSLSRVRGAVFALKENLPECTVGANTLRAGVVAERKSVVCFSVPYSKGWHARVNGKKSDVIPAQGVFCGVVLDAGESEVELVYRTPLLREGFVLMLLALAAVVFMCIRSGRGKL